MSPVSPAQCPRLCLIVEPVPLVAKDLVTTARENLGCRTLVAASEREALALLSRLDASARLTFAFIHQTAAQFQTSALRPQVERRGAGVILLGPEPGSSWPTGDWPALVWPFSTGQVLSLIEALGAPPPGTIRH